MSAIIEGTVLKKGDFEDSKRNYNSNVKKIFIPDNVTIIEKDAFPLRSFFSDYMIKNDWEIWAYVIVSVNKFGRDWEFDICYSDNKSLEYLYEEEAAYYEDEEYDEDDEAEDDEYEEDAEYEDEEENETSTIAEELINEGVLSIYEYINKVLAFFDNNCQELFKLQKTKFHSGFESLEFHDELTAIANAALENGNDEEKKNAQAYLDSLK